MDKVSYFFDSYAFFEILNKNKNYLPFIKNVSFCTFKLNLMELYYGLLKQFDRKVADKVYGRFIDYVVPLNNETIKESMIFKLLHKNKRLSYIDCLGYIFSQKYNLRFLTGDKEFKEFPGVEFVK